MPVISPPWRGFFTSLLEKGNIAEGMRYLDILEKRWNKVREKGEETISIVEKEFKNKGFQIIELSDKEGEEL